MEDKDNNRFVILIDGIGYHLNLEKYSNHSMDRKSNY